MNEIEKMLRKGIPAEEIINEVNKAKARLVEEEIARKRAEIEAKKAVKARTKVINDLLCYMKALGSTFSETEEKEFVSSLEESCKEMETRICKMNSLKEKTKDMEDDDFFIELMRTLFD